MKARKIMIADRDQTARKKMAEYFENSHYDVERQPQPLMRSPRLSKKSSRL